MNVWRAVRCCCQPTKVFGFILVEERARTIKVGGREFSIREIIHRPEIISFGDIMINQKAEVELAIYSEDHPIEFWRHQREFVEAPHED